MLVRVGIHRDDATRFRHRTVHMFKLHGRMADVEFIEQHVIDIVEHTVAGGRRDILDEHMTTQGM